MCSQNTKEREKRKKCIHKTIYIDIKLQGHFLTLFRNHIILNTLKYTSKQSFVNNCK